ncbi:flavin-containing monooxygenase [Azohydromonas aeria]|uniref:flavin-containing monooxygenase n=1 Tax=Azohydromonas aeria TaxID=2590212 RepID=UPI0018DFB66B|nr:NAD(P)/FAD-dependent oxidoreductase [Azohydromonas aeria]
MDSQDLAMDGVQDTHRDILIVGCGFAGLGMGIRLLQSGRSSFLILERAQDVGGTWRDNHYPGVACDVPSHLYSFSFRSNPAWSRVFSPGGEIQQYLRDCARDEGLLPYIRFQTAMLDARWSETQQRWTVHTTRGDFSCRVLIACPGHLADEHLPDIEGLSSFTGEVFHSARWRHDVPLQGKRIGVVGSGASAIQIVPEMAKVASELVVFQRSAPYMIPRADRAYTPAEQRLFERDPEAVRRARADIFWTGEYNFIQRRNVPRFVEEAKAQALGHLHAQVPEGPLRQALTPGYEIGCKRVLISNDYYPALQQPHVTLEPSALARVEGSHAVSASGRRFELDVLVCATGFEATRPPFARLIHGRDGTSLDAHWSQGMQAHDSIAVHGWPNLFIINGPNTGLGHNSVVYIIEAQVDYILGALAHAEQHSIAVLEADARAQERYMAELDARSQGSVWLAGGCRSWYVDERSGRLTLVWPGYAWAFRDANSRFHPEDYLQTPVAVTAGAHHQEETA